MAKNKIIYANQTYEGSQILTSQIITSNSIPSDELSIDTFNADIYQNDKLKFIPYGSNGFKTKSGLLYCKSGINSINSYPIGSETLVYHGNNLIGKFYSSKIKQTNKYTYSISCVSAIGLLDNSTHYGGIYEGESFTNVLSDIINNIFDYIVDPALDDIKIYGWLPVDTRRSNLQQLLFASGVSVLKDSNGNPMFTALNTNNPKIIAQSQIYDDCNIEYNDPIYGSEITEHTYSTSDETITLFTGEIISNEFKSPKGEIVNGNLITFSEPIHSLTISNGEIIESGVNYAVLGPSAYCTLTGKKYLHITRVISYKENQSQKNISKDNALRVTDATLISLANSLNIAKRLVAYFKKTEYINTGLVVNSEKTGDYIQINHPFTEENVNGFIKNMSSNLSGIIKASAKIIIGYTPINPGNNYNNFQVISENTNWEVPENITKIRAVLIGGGSGAEKGENGENGTDGTSSGYGKSGTGGKAGLGGNGGNIHVVDISVSPGQIFETIIGIGGNGQTSTSELTDGTDTIFGIYTSADGDKSIYGYVNLFDGKKYAVSGQIGINGGNGSDPDKLGESVLYNGETYNTGLKGNLSQTTDGVAYGGYGGGAAAGNDGENGYNGSYQKITSTININIGGNGGKGANGTNGSNGNTYGSGGNGGNGGGGGGAGGWAFNVNSSYAVKGSGGDYGFGGNGGNGANGCVIIYY